MRKFGHADDPGATFPEPVPSHSSSGSVIAVWFVKATRSKHRHPIKELVQAR